MVVRLGIVGAGRTRQGLGPFLARLGEQAGGRVVGVVGRDRASGERQAAQLQAALGHEVAAAVDIAALAADHRPDAIVIATPAEHHLAALQATLAAGVSCLCEKPLVLPAQLAPGLAAVAGFRDRGLLLDENCQWPFVLPAFDALHPGWRSTPVAEFAMGMAPAAPGPGMVLESLSHVLSVVQALLPVTTATRVVRARLADGSPGALTDRLDCELAAPDVALHLHLQVCAIQPRPAWLAVDGRRIDRRIDPGYRLSFCAGDRVVQVADPMADLVYRFVAHLPRSPLERRHALADTIAVRLRLFADIVGRL